MSTLIEDMEHFRSYLTGINTSTNVKRRWEIFQCAKALWNEVGEQPEIIEKICRAFNMTPHMFNICVEDPDLIFGIENLGQYVNEGWLKDYLDYTGTNEAPEEFHLWTGLTMMSAALRWNTCIKYNKFTVFPNLYVFLVSPPATCRKTTAGNIGIDLLEAGSNCTIIRDKATPEAIALFLSKLRPEKMTSGGLVVSNDVMSQCLIYAPELTVFLGQERYLASMTKFLTTVYDCREKQEYLTIKNKQVLLLKTYVSVLACTTPNDLPIALNHDTTEGGLITRMVMIYKTKTPREFALPIPETKEEEALRYKLIEGLREMSHRTPANYTLEPAAEKWYKNWYREWKALMESKGDIASYAQRNATLILKLSMLICVSERLGIVITVDVLTRATKIMASANESLRTLLQMFGTQHEGKPNLPLIILYSCYIIG